MWKTAASGLVLAVVIFFAARPHDEDALLSDWSSPPPWPVFIAVNVLAGCLRSAADALTPPPIRMLDMAMAYHTSILAYTAQKFSIPDIVATGPKTAAEIAVAMHTKDSTRVERLMHAMAANGIFKLGSPNSDGMPRFINSALSAVLRVDHPNSMRAMLGHNIEDMYGPWGKLPEMFGPDAKDNTWDMVYPNYPLERGGIWAKFEANPESEEQFGRAMTSLDGLGAKAMVADGPWSQFKRVVDIGGSRGHFLHSILSMHPEMKGVVFDRAPVIKNAQQAWIKGANFHDASDRVDFVSGSFFEPETLPKAMDGDAFYMRYILHDWPTDKVLTILRNLRTAMGTAKVTLLIGECALPDRHTVGVPPAMYNIDMQMMAAFGEAQERTPLQWDDVLKSTGFKLVKLHPTRSLIHWVEATPV